MERKVAIFHPTSYTCVCSVPTTWVHRWSIIFSPRFSTALVQVVYIVSSTFICLNILICSGFILIVSKSASLCIFSPVNQSYLFSFLLIHMQLQSSSNCKSQACSSVQSPCLAQSVVSFFNQLHCAPISNLSYHATGPIHPSQLSWMRCETFIKMK